MHIYFDFFGNLCDTSTTSLDATVAILERNGLNDVDPEAFKATWDAANDNYCRGDFMIERELFRRGFLTACQLFGITPASDSVDELIDATENRVLYPDAMATLERLHPHFTLHVASNTDNHAIDAIIGPLRPYLATISTSEDMQAYKPTQEFYQRMLRNGGSATEESIYVGDSFLNDVLAPTQFGIECHLLDRADAFPYLANTHSSLAAFADAMLARR